MRVGMPQQEKRLMIDFYVARNRSAPYRHQVFIQLSVLSFDWQGIGYPVRSGP